MRLNKDGSCAICNAGIGFFHQNYCTEKGIHMANEHTANGAYSPNDTALLDETLRGILDERGTTHGHFADNAMIAQAIKEVGRNSGHWHSLTPVQKECFDVIALKLSRILSGKPSFKDHWDDIAGYATLATEEIDLKS